MARQRNAAESNGNGSLEDLQPEKFDPKNDSPTDRAKKLYITYMAIGHRDKGTIHDVANFLGMKVQNCRNEVGTMRKELEKQGIELPKLQRKQGNKKDWGELGKFAETFKS